MAPIGTGNLHIVWGLVAPLVDDGLPKTVGVPSPYAVWGGGGGGGGGGLWTVDCKGQELAPVLI